MTLDGAMNEPARAIEAFEAYCALGGSRSLSKLHRHLTAAPPESWERVPSLRTFKEWSRQFSWSERVFAYDREVSAAVQEQAVEREAGERVDALSGLYGLVGVCNDIVKRAAQDMAKIRAISPQDISAVANALEKSAKVIELLEGRVTERQAGELGQMSLEDVVKRRRELEKQIAELDGPALKVVGE